MLFNFTFEGNLADEPEFRFSPSGKAVCKIRVGHNTRRRNNGEWVNGPTMWVTVTAWEALAENIAASLHKGDTVVVEARDDLSVWAYVNQHTDKAAGQLQVTAANVSRSLRFKPATAQPAAQPEAQRETRPAAGFGDDPWDTATIDREPANAF